MSSPGLESVLDRRVWADVQAGSIAVVPVMVAAVPFALALGAMATQRGLSVAEVTLMSATVFAGSAQFIAVELWTHPAPVLLLAVTTLIVNLRHVIMGAALAPHLRGFGTLGKAAALFTMADEVWALALRRTVERPLTPAFYAGLGVPLYVTWVSATATGALLGSQLDDPAAWGFDFAFVAIFLTLLVGLWRGRRSAAPWIAAAAVAIAVDALVPGAWSIFCGTLAGAAVGYWRGTR